MTARRDPIQPEKTIEANVGVRSGLVPNCRALFLPEGGATTEPVLLCCWTAYAFASPKECVCGGVFAAVKQVLASGTYRLWFLAKQLQPCEKHAPARNNEQELDPPLESHRARHEWSEERHDAKQE